MHRYALGLLLAATVAGSACAAAIDAAELPFASPQRLVDVGGHRLNLHCSGSGPVTVVFEAPAMDAGWSWAHVQPEVARRTRACVYDRAGLGFSDPSPSAPGAGQAVADLHALLGKAGIAPPYVLVGSSYGGAIAQLYAYRHPDQVKGLVLVDVSHDDEEARLDKASQGKLKQASAWQDQMMRQCAETAQRGFDRDGELYGACTGGTGAVYGRKLAAARLAVMSTGAYWRAALAEGDSVEAGGAALKAARRSFGDLPLMVLARSVSPYAVPGRPQSPLNKATEDEHLAMQKELATLSTRATLRVVPQAGHIIQHDQPQAVVAGIVDVLGQAGY